MPGGKDDEISARVERLLTAQPTAPPESRRVRRTFAIESRSIESSRHLAMQIRVDAEFAQAYRRPGQYVTLKVEGWPARFFVVAGRPEEQVWEFLVDRRGELGPMLERLSVGDELSVSLPEGVGFDPGEAAGKVAMLFCTGSGVATMRPLLQCWLDGDEAPQTVALYYGEQRPDNFAYEALLKRWESKGIDVYRAVEDGGNKTVPYRYVQHAFDDRHPPLGDGFVYLSGAPVMIQMVARKLMAMGVAPSRVKINI